MLSPHHQPLFSPPPSLSFSFLIPPLPFPPLLSFPASKASSAKDTPRHSLQEPPGTSMHPPCGSLFLSCRAWGWGGEQAVAGAGSRMVSGLWAGGFQGRGSGHPGQGTSSHCSLGLFYLQCSPSKSPGHKAAFRWEQEISSAALCKEMGFFFFFSAPAAYGSPWSRDQI